MEHRHQGLVFTESQWKIDSIIIIISLLTYFSSNVSLAKIRLYVKFKIRIKLLTYCMIIYV